MNLYHYYDLQRGPFHTLSDLDPITATNLMKEISLTTPHSFCAKRSPDYMQVRIYYENILRTEFKKKGGQINRKNPYYMIIEQSDWLHSWYEHPAYVRIPIEEFDLTTISFTYGDSHPTFSDRVNDGKEYRKKLYTYEEILFIIEKYGLPQHWNHDGKYGPERYIEAHIWDDKVVNKYIANQKIP